ncbi:hypothetical protein, partial [Klebsiella pneumoniae]|uniref:hypothetical protein n=1 Tax=Klebsiella pneumoniae TaxID=573 RepID=UPI001CB6D5E2
RIRQLVAPLRLPDFEQLHENEKAKNGLKAAFHGDGSPCEPSPNPSVGGCAVQTLNRNPKGIPRFSI